MLAIAVSYILEKVHRKAWESPASSAGSVAEGRCSTDPIIPADADADQSTTHQTPCEVLSLASASEKPGNRVFNESTPIATSHAHGTAPISNVSESGVPAASEGLLSHYGTL